MQSPALHGTVIPPDALSCRVRAVLAELGARGAARRLGLARDTLANIADGLTVRPSRLALLEHCLERTNANAPGHDTRGVPNHQEGQVPDGIEERSRHDRL